MPYNNKFCQANIIRTSFDKKVNNMICFYRIRHFDDTFILLVDVFLALPIDKYKLNSFFQSFPDK